MPQVQKPNQVRQVARTTTNETRTEMKVTILSWFSACPIAYPDNTENGVYSYGDGRHNMGGFMARLNKIQGRTK
jgi:hypothetical protein